MSIYNDYIREIEQAQTLEQIENIVWRFSAHAPAPDNGGILYSGRVSATFEAEEIAKAFAEKTGANIINNTPRGQFLGEKAIDRTIRDNAIRIFKSQGLGETSAEQSALDFLYGNAKAPPDSPLSIHNCLWCKSSREFISSLRGDVYVIAKNANPDRVLGQVELPAALANPNISTIAGLPREQMLSLEKNSGRAYALLISQNPTIAAESGITRNASGKVEFSADALTELGMDMRAVERAARDSVEHLTPPIPASRIGDLTTKGLKVAGAAAMVYDAADTANQTQKLLAQHNRTGAQSEVLHYGSRNVGMLGGAALGAGVGAALGVESGPGALVTGAAGGIMGAVYGNKLADAIDQMSIYNQRGSDGHLWRFDPQQPAQGWTRTVTTNEIDPQGMPNLEMGIPAYKTQTFPADARLAGELTYKASSTAAELALAHPGAAQDPNNSPQAIAQRYQSAYQREGWQQYGPMPGAVKAVLPAVQPSVQSPAPNAVQERQPQYPQRSGTDGPPSATSSLDSSRWEMMLELFDAADRGDHEGMRAIGRKYEASEVGRYDRVLMKASYEKMLAEEQQRTDPAHLTYRDPAHPNHGLYQALREKTPAYISNDRVAQITLECRRHLFEKGSDVKTVHVNGFNVWVSGPHPAMHAHVDLKTPAPALHETMTQARAYEAQQQQQALEQQMQRGRGFSR